MVTTLINYKWTATNTTSDPHSYDDDYVSVVSDSSTVQF